MKTNDPSVDDAAVVGARASFIDFLGILLRYRLLIFLTTTVASVAVLAFSIVSILLPPQKSYLPNLYTARAILLIGNTNTSSLSSLLTSGGTTNLSSLAGLVGGVSVNGQLAVLLAQSNSSLQSLNEKFDLSTRYKVSSSIQANTRSAILKRLDVLYDPNTSTCSVSYTDWDPGFARDVVNELVGILDRKFSALGIGKALAQKSILESKLADVQLQITSIEHDVKAFTEQHGVVEVDALATEQVAVMAQLRSSLIMKDMEIENYRKFISVEDPVLQRLLGERNSLAAKLTELEQGSGTGVLPSQRQLPDLAFTYNRLQRDLAVQNELYKILTQQYELAKFSSEGQEPAFQVVELAEAPDKKSGPSRATLCILTAVGSFLLSLLAAITLNALHTFRNDPFVRSRLNLKEKRARPSQ